MVTLDLSSALLELIDKVSQAGSERSAGMALLTPLLQLFDMEQAVFCELRENEVEILFALDRTRRILTPDKEELWISKTMMQEALQSMEPRMLTNEWNEAATDGVPKSVSRFALRNIVCFPVSRNPDRLIYLASQRNPLRRFSEAELLQFKVATRAAVLALQQQQSYQTLKDANIQLNAALEARKSQYLYASPLMGQILQEVARYAPFNISVLIQGESGVGKEELAKEIHKLSGRKGRFIAVNCANLTESLLESELFGHTKGAFTGALTNKLGLLQEANQGTFFLDEIGELPAALQAKLLRVVQERVLRPLGSNRDVAIDVRFLAATHRNLQELVTQQKFREDLFYRIQESTVKLPPLRERLEDLELLSCHFISHFSAEFCLPERKLSGEAKIKVLSYSWPGNIRELKNACRMAVILSNGVEISAENIRLHSVSKPTSLAAVEVALKAAAVSTAKSDDIIANSYAQHLKKGIPLKDILQAVERDVIQDLLSEKGATQAHVAETLGISVRTLQRIVREDESPLVTTV